MLRLSEPHGGVLVDRFVTEQEALHLAARAARLPRITLDDREGTELDLIATGAASPLTGFLGLRDYQSVLQRARLANGTPWPMPFTLATTLPRIASVLREGAAALGDPQGRLRAIITVSDVFVRNPRDEAAAMYGTDDPAHPGVRYLLSRPTGLLGGSIVVLPSEAARRGTTPREVRATAHRRRWSAVTGLATADGFGCIEGAGEGEGALLGTRRVPLRSARGRDALLQALVLKNHGAREVFLEHERSDWAAVSSGLDVEELGVTVIPIGVRGPSRVVTRHPAAAVA